MIVWLKRDCGLRGENSNVGLLLVYPTILLVFGLIWVRTFSFFFLFCFLFDTCAPPESVGRSALLDWQRFGCGGMSDVFYASGVLHRSLRRKWFEIPIPFPTYPHRLFPVSRAESASRCARAPLLASFKGFFGSSERGFIVSNLGDGKYADIVIEGTHQQGHGGSRMQELLRDSLFGLCPAGDGWHSYRLFETMAMGVVPVIVSDEWSLPFEDILDWSTFSIRVSEADIPKLREIMEQHKPRACSMSERVFSVYHQYFRDADAVVRGVLDSIDAAFRVGISNASCVGRS